MFPLFWHRFWDDIFFGCVGRRVWKKKSKMGKVPEKKWAAFYLFLCFILVYFSDFGRCAHAFTCKNFGLLFCFLFVFWCFCVSREGCAACGCKGILKGNATRRIARPRDNKILHRLMKFMEYVTNIFWVNRPYNSVIGWIVVFYYKCDFYRSVQPANADC